MPNLTSLRNLEVSTRSHDVILSYRRHSDASSSDLNDSVEALKACQLDSFSQYHANSSIDSTRHRELGFTMSATNINLILPRIPVPVSISTISSLGHTVISLEDTVRCCKND